MLERRCFYLKEYGFKCFASSEAEAVAGPTFCNSFLFVKTPDQLWVSIK